MLQKPVLPGASLALIAHILLRGQDPPCTTGRAPVPWPTPEIGGTWEHTVHARARTSATSPTLQGSFSCIYNLD